MAIIASSNCRIDKYLDTLSKKKRAEAEEMLKGKTTYGWSGNVILMHTWVETLYSRDFYFEDKELEGLMFVTDPNDGMGYRLKKEQFEYFKWMCDNIKRTTKRPLMVKDIKFN